MEEGGECKGERGEENRGRRKLDKEERRKQMEEEMKNGGIKKTSRHKEGWKQTVKTNNQMKWGKN